MPDLEGPKHSFNELDVKNALDSCASVYQDNEFYVVGSMSVLAKGQVPNELRVSHDIDLYPKHKPSDGALAQEHFGPESDFVKEHGFTIEGVGDWTTMTTPPGWEQRTIAIRTENGVTGYCLAPIDLAFNKIEAGRTKDLVHVALLIKHDFVKADELRAVLNEHSRYPENRSKNLKTLETILEQMKDKVKEGKPTHARRQKNKDRGFGD
jgi:hypothetical protein